MLEKNLISVQADGPALITCERNDGTKTELECKKFVSQSLSIKEGKRSQIPPLAKKLHIIGNC